MRQLCGPSLYKSSCTQHTSSLKCSIFQLHFLSDYPAQPNLHFHLHTDFTIQFCLSEFSTSRKMPSQVQSDSSESECNWTFHPLHETTLAPKSKEELLRAFAEWAPTYDEDIRRSDPVFYHKTGEEVLARLGKREGRVRVLDVGCGTGLSGEPISQMAADRELDLDLIGLDYSKEMIDIAREKKLYSSLAIADVTKPLPIPEASIDAFFACGLFVANQCSPDGIVNIARPLKPNGFGVFTVRGKGSEDLKHRFSELYPKCGLEQVDIFVANYIGNTKAEYIIVKKTA